MYAAIRNPVRFGLALVATVAALSFGFVDVAPNRLVSGRPVALWSAVGVPTLGLLAAISAALLATALLPPRRATSRAAMTLGVAGLLTSLFALGFAARDIAAVASPATRISAGAAFWIMTGCFALAVVDAAERLGGVAAALAAVLAVGGGAAVLAAAGAFAELSIAREYAARRTLFAAAVGRHLSLVAGAVGPALALGFPLGVAAARKPKLQGPLFAALNLLQTVPSIALFGLLIVPLSTLSAAVPPLAALGIGGIGVAPAVVALVLYALLPIVRNTAAGLGAVDPAVMDAARGMGLGRRQILWRIELPLALPVLLAGLRIVIVQAIGLAVVAALIGAGGLGSFVFEGLGQYALDLVLLGALPVIALALAADFALRVLATLLPPRVAG